MKKLQMVLLALVAVFAFSAVIAASASAETTLLAEWLANGNPITVALASETKGNILLEDNNANGGTSVLCSGILVGTVGANGADEITEVRDLTGANKIELTAGKRLVCENEKGCGGTPEVAAEKLPWPTLLFLMENGEILDLIVGAEYASFCTVFGIRLEDKCSAADAELPVLNDPVTGDADTPGESIVTPNATCSIGGANAGVNETDELSELSLVNGELLTVSSE